MYPPARFSGLFQLGCDGGPFVSTLTEAQDGDDQEELLVLAVSPGWHRGW